MRAAAFIPTSPSDMASQREKLGRASDYLGWVHALIVAKGDHIQAAATFDAKPTSRIKAVEMVRKAAISAGRTDGTTWGSQIAELRPGADEFIELVRSRSILGPMAGFRKIPFHLNIPRQTSSAMVGWVSQEAPVLVSNPTFDDITFEESKVGGIVVVSSELARSAQPAAQQLINNDLIGSAAAFLDASFLDPTIAAVGDAPASITHGIAPISASGTTADAFKADLKALIADLVGRGGQLTNLYLVMSKVMAASIALLDDTLGRTLGPNGGAILNIPVVTTTVDQSEGNSPPTERIVAVDTSDVLLADAGVEIAVSGEATIQMDTAPDSPATGATVLVSLWQRNLVAVKINRTIRWERARESAAGYITGARYGA